MNNEFLIWSQAYREGFCVIDKLQGFKEQWLLQKGVALAEKWPDNVTFSMTPRYPKDIKLSDGLFGSSYRVISNRVKDLLAALAAASNIEFLPVSILNHKGRVASTDYFILNPLDVVDCIDQDKSGIVWNPIDPSIISSVEKFVLRDDAIPKGSAIFRPNFMQRTILTKREVAAKLLAADLTGVFFTEASTYTG